MLSSLRLGEVPWACWSSLHDCVDRTQANRARPGGVRALWHSRVPEEHAACSLGKPRGFWRGRGSRAVVSTGSPGQGRVNGPGKAWKGRPRETRLCWGCDSIRARAPDA